MVGLIASAASNKDFRNATGKAIRFVASVAGGFVAYKLLQNFYLNYARSQAQHGLLDSKEARQAQQLKVGMNPSGFDWAMNVDGTNKSAIYSAAQLIDDFPEVQKKYSQLYPNRNLVQDLESELDNEQLNQFYGYMQKGQIQKIAASAKPSTNYKFNVGDKVFANGRPFMYSFPASGAEEFQIMETNAPLGKVVKRLSKQDGNWYLIDMGKGLNPYFKEAGLL